MKLAIMQPYLFPYIGYYQLIAHVDKFVILDDVNYINRGWINRNRILVNGKPHMFTLPLDQPSQNKYICNTNIAGSAEKWRDKFYRALQHNYRKAPYYDNVMSLLHDVLDEIPKKLTDLLIRTLKITIDYLALSTEQVISSRIYNNRHLSGQERIIDICLKENCRKYVNLSGGMEIYTEEAFSQHDIDLTFIQSGNICYQQFSPEFVPWLSILDVMMFNSPIELKHILKSYELLNAPDTSLEKTLSQESVVS